MILSDEQFNELVRKYYHQILCLCQKIVRNVADAEDCTQEAFLSAYRKREQFEGHSSFYTWIYRIAFNCCLMFLRSRRGKEFCELTEETAVSKEFKAADLILLYGLVSKLSEMQSRAIIATLYGLKVREIAILEAASEAAIKTRLLRARQVMAAEARGCGKPQNHQEM